MRMPRVFTRLTTSATSINFNRNVSAEARINQFSLRLIKTVAVLTAALTLAIGLPSTASANQEFFCGGAGRTYWITTAGEVRMGGSCIGDIEIPSWASATSIGDGAFQSASGLTSVTIPSSVLSIGDYAFNGTTLLNTITVDAANANFSSVDGVLFNKLQTRLIYYPGAKTATSYIVPNSVTSIGSNAFDGIRFLNSIVIPSEVLSFGSNIFPFFMFSPLTSYTYCGDASLVGTGISGTQTSCSSAAGAPTIGTATATGTTSATVSFTAPGSNGGSTISKYIATSNPGSITAEVIQATSGTISVTGLSPSTSYTFTITALNSVGPSSASAASNSITTSAALASGIAPLFTSASSYDGRFTVQIKDYDEAFTYAATSSAGQTSISSTGLITVTGLKPDQSVTVSVTSTRAGYASATGSVTGSSQVAPMLPGTKPIVTLSDTLITCTIGSYSATPTSSAFSLFVDGKHIATIFSALGEYLPDWIIPWATTSSITRTATLTSATWAMTDAYKGKPITCATLAYSKNAIGFTASQVMVAR